MKMTTEMTKIEWLGARLTKLTFLGEFFFPSKVSEFLHVLLKEVGKHSPVCFWLVCTLFLKKIRTKYRSMHNERNKGEQDHFSPKNMPLGECLILSWKAQAKIQALLKKKKFTWKSHLGQSCTKPLKWWGRRECLLLELSGKKYSWGPNLEFKLYIPLWCID